LTLDDTRVGDAGLAHLARLLRLRSLSHTRISDAGLAHLARLPRLQVLVLNGTRVTDTGLARILHRKCEEYSCAAA
jgi:hypothetical protein